MYQMLRQKNDGLSVEVANFAQQIISIPSVSCNEQAVADKVESLMQALGYEKVCRDDVGNVVGVMFGRDCGPTLALVSHMDTIAPEEGKWTMDPYKPEIRGGRLYGLGASDAKANLVAQIYAGCLIKRSLLPLWGNIVVAATVAEENGCSVGVRHLMSKTFPELELQPHFAILAEPTGMGLYYGHDGWAELDIRVDGANPFEVDDVARAIHRDFGSESRGQELFLDPVSFTRASGARHATIGVRTRLHEADAGERLAGSLRHQAKLVADSIGNVAVEVAVRHQEKTLYNGTTTMVRRVVNAWQTDPFCPLMERSRQALAAAECPAKAGRWSLGRLGMGTAGSVLVNDYNLPTIGYGPGDEESAHCPDESVSLKALSQAVYGTAAIAHGLVGVPVFGWTADEI
jgi:acetylornithine deacetylase/succinyl-diaminopimelate desuccinylase-like protein